MVILPTGMGKTVIALRVILGRLNVGPILLMAPTKPLAQQHAEFLEEHLSSQVTLFTGAIPPLQREPLWKSSGIIVSTPQVVSKDIVVVDFLAFSPPLEARVVVFAFDG